MAAVSLHHSALRSALRILDQHAALAALRDLKNPALSFVYQFGNRPALGSIGRGRDAIANFERGVCFEEHGWQDLP